MQSSDNEKFVVIGAGQAGGRAVEAMRRAGFAGRIDLVGAEPHLPYERPPLSKELLAADAGDLQTMFDEAWFRDQDIALHLGVEATAIDRAAKQVRLGDGATLPYDRLLLTTGGVVRELDIEGASLPGVHTLRTIEDNRAIAALLAAGGPIVVVGGGFIGLEGAASAQMRGCAVTVLEFADRLMGRALPPEISDIFAAWHRANGVDIRLGTGIARIEGAERAEAVVTTAGDRIAAQGVIVGVGIGPRTGLAEAAGLAVDNGDFAFRRTRISMPPGMRPASGTGILAAICGSNPGRTPRTRQSPPRKICAARTPLSPRSRGSGRISSMSTCRCAARP